MPPIPCLRTVFIYMLCHPETGEPRYIGKTVSPAERLKGHIQKPHAAEKAILATGQYVKRDNPDLCAPHFDFQPAGMRWKVCSNFGWNADGVRDIKEAPFMQFYAESHEKAAQFVREHYKGAVAAIIPA